MDECESYLSAYLIYFSLYYAHIKRLSVNSSFPFISKQILDMKNQASKFEHNTLKDTINLSQHKMFSKNQVLQKYSKYLLLVYSRSQNTIKV